MFKTEGRIDRPFYKRLGNNFYTPKARIVRVIYVLFAIIFAFLAFSRRLNVVAVPVLICAFAIFSEPYITRQRYIKTLFKSLKEASDIEAIEYIVSLEDEYIEVTNKFSKGSDRFEYSSFVKSADTGEEILLFTKEWQMIPIFKSGLSGEELEKMSGFLKEKCKKIKKW